MAVTEEFYFVWERHLIFLQKDTSDEAATSIFRVEKCSSPKMRWKRFLTKRCGKPLPGYTASNSVSFVMPSESVISQGELKDDRQVQNIGYDVGIGFRTQIITRQPLRH
jgi:hypothetical protein